MGRKVTRLYTGPDNESHFEDIDIPLLERKAEGIPGATSKSVEAKAIKFREVAPHGTSDWHCAPHRQYYVVTEGSIEIEVGDGTIRRFGPGEIFLAEDTTGHGHVARTTGKGRKAVIITLPD
jgi:quercetin dioxygenase-like cupin family protein